jgi:branched-chain amino acid transport system permease protein
MMRSQLMVRRRRQHFIWLGAVLLLVLIPVLLHGGYEQTIVVTIELYAIFGIGLQMTLGTAGILNMGHAAFIGLGAYSSGIVTAAGGNAWLGMLAGIVVSAAFALLIGLPILRLRSLYLAIATLCFALAITNVIGVWTPVTGGQNGLTRISPFQIGDFKFTSLPSQVYLIGAFLLIFMLLRINLRYSVAGREFEAIKDSELATSSLGINHGLRKLQIFTLGSVIGAVGGSLYASYLSAITPELFGFGLLIQIFVIVALGGMNSLWGAPIGAILVVLTNQFLLPALAGGASGPVELVLFGALLVVIMMFAPRGLVDELTALVMRLIRRRKRLAVAAEDEKEISLPESEPVAVNGGVVR